LFSFSYFFGDVFPLLQLLLEIAQQN